jgi:hypothetical protein
MIFQTSHWLSGNVLRLLKAAVSAEVVVTARLPAMEVPLHHIERLPTAIASQVDARENISSNNSMDLFVCQSHHMSHATPWDSLRASINLLRYALLVSNL